MDKTYPFEEALRSLPPKICKMLSSLDDQTKANIQEIRLRAGSKITLRKNNELCTLEHLPEMTAADIAEAFESMCGYSVYAHQNSVAKGYITVRGGHRAGICGTAVINGGGQVTMLRDISAINLRIAREFAGCSSVLFSSLEYSEPCGILIAGAPMSGKTTLLRDIASSLSNGLIGRRYAVSVLDERGELAAVLEGTPQYKSIRNCDILSGYPKGEAIALAVRSMSPEIIVCDEIGTKAEAEAIKETLNAGVKVIASIHAGSEKEIFSRPATRKLIETGAFRYIALLSAVPLGIEKVIDTEESENEACDLRTYYADIDSYRKRIAQRYKEQVQIA